MTLERLRTLAAELEDLDSEGSERVLPSIYIFKRTEGVSAHNFSPFVTEFK